MSAGHKPSWVVDPSRIATKIRSASCLSEHGKEEWKSNPTKSCPRCQFVIDNSDVAHEWPGLPQGVKFDPSDPEIIWHLLAKVGVGSYKLHPFIDEFIPTVKEDDGICYTHPQNLPGVKQDGSVAHFFHRAIKAYNTGTRKRRKILGDDLGDVRWHKTGRTKPVLLDGVQKGCKKIMVLYVTPVRGGKAEKTNWVMHQYHLGTGEDEMEGEYIISKVFYQQQQVKQGEKIEDIPGIPDAIMIPKVDPVTPKLVTPEPARIERKILNIESAQGSTLPNVQHQNEVFMLREVETPSDCNDLDENNLENQALGSEDKNDDGDNEVGEDKGWEDESPYLLSSQQLMEAISLYDDFFQSQSPGRTETGNGQERKKPLSDYANLRTEDFKKDIEECKKLVAADLSTGDLPNIEIDTPIRLSQIEFESQDSFVAWGGSTCGGKILESQDSWPSLPN